MRHLSRWTTSTTRLEKLHKRGAQLEGEVVQSKDAYPLCYIRGPEGFSSDSLKNSAERRHHNAEIVLNSSRAALLGIRLSILTAVARNLTDGPTKSRGPADCNRAAFELRDRRKRHAGTALQIGDQPDLRRR